MEISEKTVHDVVHPTAAFCHALPGRSIPVSHDKLPSWGASTLNPKNRIESFEVPKDCQWRIDGCTGLGSQYYAVPDFLQPLVPLRVDVFIPEPCILPSDMRDLLHVDEAFYTRDAVRVSRLAITRHILRILHHWTSHMSDPLGTIYSQIPFGSRIVIQNVPKDPAEARIVVAPMHDLERQLLSPEALQRAWGPNTQLPPLIDLEELHYLRQLHDSVCLVRYKDDVLIFKTLTSYTKYLYHELRQLLRLPAHPNVIGRPIHVVVKRCKFGGKQAVVGFTLKYHIGGSLRDFLPFENVHQRVTMDNQAKWALQLASALIAIRKETGSFYPDLRLDNIVLSESHDVVMVDFEQRGVWCEFAAPEVNAIEYARLLAVDTGIPPSIRAKYEGILDSMLPQWREMEFGEEYTQSVDGYNIAWSCLSPREQEACEVYMLGRVLWCIFEAASAPQRAAVWLSYKWEPVHDFPTYTKTPTVMRQLIDRCTRGRRPGLSQHIVRSRNQLVLLEHEKSGRSTPEQVQTKAKEWWLSEIEASERWLAKRKEGMLEGGWNENYYNRPSMREVRDAIHAFRKEQGFAALEL